MKKFLKYFSQVSVFTLAIIIMVNYYRLNNGNELSSAEKHLKHFLTDHKFNESNFSFIKLNFNHTNYFEKRSDALINIPAEISLFLISYTVIFYASSGRKNFFAEKFLFAIGFANSLFRPPKYIS